jgi:ABC-2 type transport system ATP-binding protein
MGGTPVTRRAAKEAMGLKIEVEGLTKTYEGGIHALKGISLTITNGVYGLLGPNGSGKTTLMRILATLLPPSEGTARVDGHDVRHDRLPIRRVLGYLPQDYGLYPNLTVAEQLEYSALLCDIKGRKAQQDAIERGMASTNIAHLAGRKVGTLSGGMRQRVGIAQALLNSPQLLIIDEPTSGLDPEERIRIRSLLAELSGDRVIMLSTHIVADVEATALNVGILHFGRLLFDGTCDDLIRSAQGKVWLMDVDRQQLVDMKEQFTLSGVFRHAGGLQIRVLADAPPRPDAKAVDANMEDAYLRIMEHDTAVMANA